MEVCGSGATRMGVAPAAKDCSHRLPARELLPIMRWTWERTSVAVRRETWWDDLAISRCCSSRADDINEYHCLRGRLGR